MECDRDIYIFRPPCLRIWAADLDSIVNEHNSLEDVSTQVLFLHFPPASLRQITHKHARCSEMQSMWNIYAGRAQINVCFVAS